MLNVKRILVPSDGSPCAERACEHATFLADTLGAHLDIVEVVPEDQQPGSTWLRDVKVTEADICDDLRLLIDEREKGTDDETPHVVRRKAYHDTPTEGILRYASEHDVDLILMGTHGRDRLDQLVLGSVAERVVRQADCPVLTVNHENDVTPQDEVADVLCPVDFSAFSEQAVRCAAAIASTYDAHLHLLHVEEEESPIGIAPEDSAAQVVGGDPRKAMETLVGEVDVPLASVHVASGDPRTAIVTFADEQEADLIVLTTHGRTGLKRVLLGSVAEAVVRNASCPVLTLRAFGKNMMRTIEEETEVEVE